MHHMDLGRTVRPTTPGFRGQAQALDAGGEGPMSILSTEDLCCPWTMGRGREGLRQQRVCVTWGQQTLREQRLR